MIVGPLKCGTPLLGIALVVLAFGCGGQNAPPVSAPGDGGIDRTRLPVQEPVLRPLTELDVRNAEAPPRFEVKAPADAPNVVIVLIDDMGFGQPSAFGGGVAMPTLDRLAADGLRFNNMHVTALCSPTRAALLT